MDAKIIGIILLNYLHIKNPNETPILTGTINQYKVEKRRNTPLQCYRKRSINVPMVY